jgi:hypothetical protein
MKERILLKVGATMKYTLEMYDTDIAALNQATNALSAFIAGEGEGRLTNVSAELLNITNYWTPEEAMWEPMTKMMIDLVENGKVSGINGVRYAALLAQAVKKVKSMRPFFRKKKQPCLYPQFHRQPCYCGNMANATGYVMGETKPVEVNSYDKKAEQLILKAAIERLHA